VGGGGGRRAGLGSAPGNGLGVADTMRKSSEKARVKDPRSMSRESQKNARRGGDLRLIDSGRDIYA
jgi:hypothetical protein